MASLRFIAAVALMASVLWWSSRWDEPVAAESWFEAAQNGDVAAMDASIEQRVNIDATDASGFTALMIAARAGRYAAVERLIARGADMEVRSRASGTALMQAALHGHEDIVDLLLAHGADVNACTDQGQTALGYAIIGDKCTTAAIDRLAAAARGKRSFSP
jgi:hypothetical protein